MTEGTKRSRKRHSDKAMNSSPNTPEASMQEMDGSPKPALQPVSPDQIEEPTHDAQGVLSFHLADTHHAQVTRVLLEQQQVGAAIVGVDGKIHQANHALARLLQYKQEELTGKTLEHPALRAEQAQNLRVGSGPLTAKCIQAPVLTHLARKSGATVACLTDFHPICDDNSKVTHFLVFVGRPRGREDAEEPRAF